MCVSQYNHFGCFYNRSKIHEKRSENDNNYSYHMTADMIYNVCYFYCIVHNDSYTFMFMCIVYTICNDIN